MFEWSPRCQHAFEKLKRLLTSAPILSFPNFTKRFILETHASGVGLGAVLSHKKENGLGKTNQNADTLSCTPFTCYSKLPEGSEEKVVAALIGFRKGRGGDDWEGRKTGQ